MTMSKRDLRSLIKNVYDDSTIDTLRALDSNLLTLMSHNQDYKNIEINQYERVPLKPGSPQSRIRVDISKNGVKSFFFLSEELVTRFEESNDIRRELINVMNQIKAAFLPVTKK
jgi:hypothetical protein